MAAEGEPRAATEEGKPLKRQAPDVAVDELMAQQPRRRRRGKDQTPTALSRAAFREAARKGIFEEARAAYEAARRDGIAISSESYDSLFYLSCGGDSWEADAPSPAAAEARRPKTPERAADGAGGGMGGVKPPAGGGEGAEAAPAALCTGGRGIPAGPPFASPSEALAFGRRLFEEMQAADGISRPSEMCFTALARLASVAGDTVQALRLARRCGDLGIVPRLRLYVPALASAARRGQAAAAFATYGEMCRVGLEPGELEYRLLFRAAAGGAGYQRVEPTLRRIGDELGELDAATVESIGAYFLSPSSAADEDAPAYASGRDELLGSGDDWFEGPPKTEFARIADGALSAAPAKRTYAAAGYAEPDAAPSGASPAAGDDAAPNAAPQGPWRTFLSRPDEAGFLESPGLEDALPGGDLRPPPAATAAAAASGAGSSPPVAAAGPARRLRAVDLTPAEFSTFRAGIRRIAGRMGQGSGHVEAFDAWLSRHGPFDAVVDAANVAFYGQNFESGGFNFRQIGQVLDHLRDGAGGVVAEAAAAADGRDPASVPGDAAAATKPAPVPVPHRVLAVLHEGRTRPKAVKTEAGRELLAALRASKSLYEAPQGTNDDWFWMYAAVTAGKAGVLVSNDEMRDHIFQLLAPRYFRRWKQRHQYRYHIESGDITLFAPRPFTVCAQQLDPGCWAFPRADGLWLVCDRARRD